MFVPEITVPAEAPAAPSGLKLQYEIGDQAWIDCGHRDKNGNAIKAPGVVVTWFDLPDYATRFYLVKLFGDYIHLMCRDALTMSPDQATAFPWSKTRHDNAARVELRQIEWRH